MPQQHAFVRVCMLINTQDAYCVRVIRPSGKKQETEEETTGVVLKHSGALKPGGFSLVGFVYLF